MDGSRIVLEFVTVEKVIRSYQKYVTVISNRGRAKNDRKLETVEEKEIRNGCNIYLREKKSVLALQHSVIYDAGYKTFRYDPNHSKEVKQDAFVFLHLGRVFIDKDCVEYEWFDTTPKSLRIEPELVCGVSVERHESERKEKLDYFKKKVKQKISWGTDKGIATPESAISRKTNNKEAPTWYQLLPDGQARIVLNRVQYSREELRRIYTPIGYLELDGSAIRLRRLTDNIEWYQAAYKWLSSKEQEIDKDMLRPTALSKRAALFKRFNEKYVPQPKERRAVVVIPQHAERVVGYAPDSAIKDMNRLDEVIRPMKGVIDYERKSSHPRKKSVAQKWKDAQNRKASKGK